MFYALMQPESWHLPVQKENRWKQTIVCKRQIL